MHTVGIRRGQDFWTTYWTTSDSIDKYTTCTIYSVKLGSGVDIGTEEVGDGWKHQIFHRMVRLKFIHFVPPKGSLLFLYKSDPCYLTP